MNAKEFTWPIRVYWEDTDGGGVVFYANYLKYMERARTEWLRALGFHQRRLQAEQGIVFVVTSLSVNFVEPARLDDQLLVISQMPEIGGASFGFRQRIVRQESPEKVMLTSDVNAACLDATTFKPRRMPAELRAVLPV
jgi:acyl-CoA thioester hydrolase